MRSERVTASDIRDTALYQEAESLYRALRQPGTGFICDAAEIHVAPNGREAVFVGTLTETLEKPPQTRICNIDLTSSDHRVLTFGPNSDRLPRYSPDASQIAFLSDRHKPGDFQLYLLDVASGTARRTPPVDGWVEYLHWSPDGRRILLGVSGHGADIAGTQGGIPSKAAPRELPAWMPSIATRDESFRWRRAWIYELEADRVRCVSREEVNVWEAAWCGTRSLVAVTSTAPGEGHWYRARLCVIDITNGESREIHSPQHQLGWPAASPSGTHVAVVEALCSDRWLVAGTLRLIDVASGHAQLVNTRGIDITFVEWRSDRRILVGGYRGLQTVVGLYDVAMASFTETWSSWDLTTNSFSIGASGLNDEGDFALVSEGFVRAPQIAVVRQGRHQCIRSFDTRDGAAPWSDASFERVQWQARDRLEIQGWLLKPRGSGPFPLVINVHGGPVNLWRPLWLGRRGIPLLMLIERGYAVLLPNPRGSSGRGLEFARGVVGDMGGADMHDHLSGVDHLVAAGVADAARIGIMGASYGGFMTSWIITRDMRFAAAVSVAPVTNQVTERLLSNIPDFVDLFLADHYHNPHGPYFERSPVMYARHVRTPTLSICGAQDRCTPPEEAMQFHNALLENDIESVLVLYPEEGHGIRKLPAAIDYAARVVAWFEKHMPARGAENKHQGNPQ